MWTRTQTTWFSKSTMIRHALYVSPTHRVRRLLPLCHSRRWMLPPPTLPLSESLSTIAPRFIHPPHTHSIHISRGLSLPRRARSLSLSLSTTRMVRPPSRTSVICGSSIREKLSSPTQTGNPPTHPPHPDDDPVAPAHCPLTPTDSGEPRHRTKIAMPEGDIAVTSVEVSFLFLSTLSPSSDSPTWWAVANDHAVTSGRRGGREETASGTQRSVPAPLDPSGQAAPERRRLWRLPQVHLWGGG